MVDPRGGRPRSGAPLALSVPANPAYISVIRLFAGAVARQVGLDDELVDDLRLAVSEACTDVMESGGPARIEVTLFAEPDRLAVAVRGEGPADRVPAAIQGPMVPRIDRHEVIRALFPDAEIVGTDESKVVRFSVASRQQDPA
jgi:anti-sigma regulatory factor (Ser/Thr protein kinase)